MDRDEEIETLWSMGIGTGKGWRQSDIPIASRDKGAVKRAWAKITKNMQEVERMELLNKIKDAIVAQTRFRRDEKAAGDQLSQPVRLSRYLSEERWLDPIGSHYELNQKQKEKEQKFCECGQPVHPGQIKCPYCYSTLGGRLMPELREIYVKNGLKRGEGEGKDEHIARMRTLSKEYLRTLVG